jgi:hypothetical protein
MIVRRWAELWTMGDMAGADQILARNVRDDRTPPIQDIDGFEEE